MEDEHASNQDTVPAEESETGNHEIHKSPSNGADTMILRCWLSYAADVGEEGWVRAYLRPEGKPITRFTQFRSLIMPLGHKETRKEFSSDMIIPVPAGWEAVIFKWGMHTDFSVQWLSKLVDEEVQPK